MGRVTGDPVLLYRLNEQTVSVFPSDARGNLADLDAAGPNSRPLVSTDTLTGFGRVFSGAVPTGVQAVDTDANLNLTRSCTVHTIIDWDRAAQISPGVLCALGFRDSSPGEDLQMWVQLEQGSGGNTGKITMRWENTSGSLITNAGAEFVVPTQGGFLLLTAVREWRSPTDVIVRYYGNGAFLDKNLSTDGNIGGVAGATFSMGVAGDGAGGYTNYLEGTVDQLAVYDFAMTAEEVRQIFLRVALHPVQQYEALKTLLPKDVYTIDPSSIFQRELFAEAQMFALIASKFAELREDFLPDRAWSFLERWESVTALIPNPSDTLAERRNRILTALRTIEGFSIPGIQNALEQTLDILATQVQVCENTHFLADDLDTAIPNFMHQVPQNGALSITASRLQIDANAIQAGWVTAEAPQVRVTIDRNESQTDPSKDAEVNVALTIPAAATLDQAVLGVMFANFCDNTAFVVGLTTRNGPREIVAYEINDDGVGNDVYTPTTPTLIKTGWTDGDFLNIKMAGINISAFDMEISEALAADRDALTALTTYQTSVLTDPRTLVIGVFEHPQETVTAAADAGAITDFRLYTPNGPSVYTWFAYRNPALPGAADIPGAQVTLDRMKPAHTRGFATETKALICDDPLSTCDGGPMGS